MRRMQETQRETNLFLNDFEVCDRYGGGLKAAARIACPVTFVLGARDQMTQPGQAGELAAALGARVVTLPCGHSLMSEAPDAVLGAIRDAIAG
jgi:pimeloyl-ACP methyl ester carboxylesterase